MSKDELEKYIEQHRGSFDQVESLNVNDMWDRMENKIDEFKNDEIPKGNKLKYFLWIAFIALCVFLGSYLNSIFNQNQSFETMAGLTKEQELQRDKMLQTVDFKERKLREKNIDMSSLGVFAKELQGLDEIEQLIISDFPESVNREKLVKSMLQYYESKARILELILLEIEKKETNEIYESEIF